MNFKISTAPFFFVQSMIFMICCSLFLSANADFKNDLPISYPSDPVYENQKTEKRSSKHQRSPKKTEKKAEDAQPPSTAPQKTSLTESEGGGLFGDGLTHHNAAAPVYFQGKSGDGSRKLGILNLVGDVLIRQDDTTLTSDKAHLFGSAGSVPGSGTNSIQKAIAVGNVHIFKKVSEKIPEIKALGERVEFDVKNRILLLKGNAKVWRADEYLNADSIQLNLNTGEMKLLDPKGTMNPKSAGGQIINPTPSKN